MKTRFRSTTFEWAVVSCCLATMSAGWAAYGDGLQKVSGQVIDADGKPCADITIATFWNAAAGEQAPIGTMRAFNGVKTDADGRFTFEVEFHERSQAMLAIDAEGRRGGLAVVDPTSAGDAQTITLAPLVSVKGRFSCDELRRSPGWTNVYINVERENQSIRLVQCASDAAEFAFTLPPGTYDFDGYGSDVKGVSKTLCLSEEWPTLDVGTIDLKATEIAKHVGKAPPAWSVSDARGVPKTVQLADYKGKWVLLEFWGFW